MTRKRRSSPPPTPERGDDRLAHHRPDGGFRNPWQGDGNRGGGFLRWRWQRWVGGTAPERPPPAALPVVPPGIKWPRAGRETISLTWVGHATFLIQVSGFNVLTDPVWSERVSPVRWAGPRRLAPPGVALEQLPPIDAVLISHDHYDHLDSPTVRTLTQRFGERLQWITPLGYGRWLARHGVSRIAELDWHETTALTQGAARLDLTALPAHHWTRRSLLQRSHRLWASFAINGGSGGRVYFGGDSAYFPGYARIGERYGPFAATLLPIGAYEPRWFMKGAHMSPEEAVRAWQDLGAEGVFLGMHWGTFMLSDEPPLEPPARVRSEWAAQGLDPERLVLLRHGETWCRAAGQHGASRTRHEGD